MDSSRPGARRRLIVNTDAKNEADDQFAIAHALLTPMFDVRGIIPTHFGLEKSATSMQDSREEVDLILRLMSMENEVTVVNGAEHALPDEFTPVDSEGARLIIEESMSDESTLYLAFLGPLTDMASALLLYPELRHRDIVVVWVGGAPYGERAPAYWPEFNLRNDVASANVVLSSGIEVWQIPMSTYIMMGVGHVELEEKIAGAGAIGRYLTDQLIAHNESGSDPMGVETRALGDTAAIGLIMSPWSGVWREQAPVLIGEDFGYIPGEPGRPIRVYESVDSRLMLEDLFSKLRRFAAQSRGG